MQTAIKLSSLDFGKVLVVAGKLLEALLLLNGKGSIVSSYLTAGLEVCTVKDGVPGFCSGIVFAVREGYSILERLIEDRTYVLTNESHYVVVTVLGTCRCTGKLFLIVLLKNVGRVSRLIVKECRALRELSGVNRDTAKTTGVVHQGLIISEGLACCVTGVIRVILCGGKSGVKRTGSDSEAAVGVVLDIGVFSFLKVTGDNEATEEKLALSEFLSYRGKLSFLRGCSINALYLAIRSVNAGCGEEIVNLILESEELLCVSIGIKVGVVCPGVVGAVPLYCGVAVIPNTVGKGLFNDGEGGGVKNTRGGEARACLKNEAEGISCGLGAGVIRVNVNRVGILLYSIIGPVAVPNKLNKVVNGEIAVGSTVRTGSILECAGGGESAAKLFLNCDTGSVEKVNVSGNEEECTNGIGEVVRAEKVHLRCGKGKRLHEFHHVAFGVADSFSVILILYEAEIVGSLLSGLEVSKATLKGCSHHVVKEGGIHIGLGSRVCLNEVAYVAPAVIPVVNFGTVKPVIVFDGGLGVHSSLNVTRNNRVYESRTVGVTAREVSSRTRGKLAVMAVKVESELKVGGGPGEVTDKDFFATVVTDAVTVSIVSVLTGAGALYGCAADITLAVAV